MPQAPARVIAGIKSASLAGTSQLPRPLRAHEAKSTLSLYQRRTACPESNLTAGVLIVPATINRIKTYFCSLLLLMAIASLWLARH